MTFSRLALITTLASTLALAGCSDAQLESPPQDMAVSSLAEESALDSGRSMSSDGSSQARDRKEPSVITTGYLSLIVDTPSDSADVLAEIVTPRNRLPCPCPLLHNHTHRACSPRSLGGIRRFDRENSHYPSLFLPHEPRNDLLESRGLGDRDR